MKNVISNRNFTVRSQFAKVAKKVKLTYPILANLANVAVGI